MPDFGSSGRVDTYRCTLVDPFTLEDTGEVEADAAKSSINWGYYTDNLVSGSLSLSGSDYRQGALDRMVRIRQRTRIGGYDEERVLATLFVDNASTSSLFGEAKRSLNCYSALWRYTQDVLSQDFFRAAGYNVVQAVRDIVEVDGGHLKVEPGVDEDRAFTRDIWFELGENRATVIRTIAGWINCQIGISPWGEITIKPYLAPRDKGSAYTFQAGNNCVYIPGIDWSTNRGEPVNRVVAYFSRETAKDDDPFPLTDRVQVDLEDGREFSYARCGRRRCHVMKLSEPCGHAELEQKAQTYLNENSGAALYIEIEHTGVPNVGTGDTVRYVNDTDHATPVDVLCLVSEMDMPALSLGAMTKTKLKVIT